MSISRSLKARLLWPLLRRCHPDVTLRLPSKRMRVDLRDAVISRLLFVEGEFDPEKERLMRHMALEGAVCVDVGANLGLHTVTMAKLAGAYGRVYAFEPERRNFELLRSNISLNGLRNVVALKRALGSAPGSCGIAVNAVHYGDHRVRTIGGDGCVTERVQMTTLDEALKDVPPGRVKLVKIDVQGFECHVLEGARETIERNPQAFVFIEVFPDALREAGRSATELVEMLAALGLVGFEVGERRVTPLAPAWAYELVREGADVDLLVSREPAALERVLARAYGYSSLTPT